MRILLEYGADLNVFTNKSRSPLHYAVISQCSDVVELILANKPALINKADATGKTPLHTAASYGSAEIVECLLNNGASILKYGRDFKQCWGLMRPNAFSILFELHIIFKVMNTLS